MNTTIQVLLLLGVGLIAGMGLYAIRSQQFGFRSISQALHPAWFLAPLLAYLLAKLVYVSFRFDGQIRVYGITAFFRLHGEEFSFAAGCTGFVLGIGLSTRIRKARSGPALDAFAPAGCLMIAIARAVQLLQGSLGLGDYLEDALHFFPVSVQNQYGEWYLAVCMLEALVALICMMICLLERHRYDPVPGMLFERTVGRLCAAQVFLEYLRAVTLSYSFVRIDQVIAAVILFVIVCRCCHVLQKTHSKSSKAGAYSPAIWLFVLIAINGVLQFAVDKPYWFVERLPVGDETGYAIEDAIPLIGYIGMFLTAVGMLWIVERVEHLRLQSVTSIQQ